MRVLDRELPGVEGLESISPIVNERPRRGPPRIPSGPTERLEAMVRFMACEYRNSITLADVAKAAGLHPNYACSLFSRVCGISMRAYLNRLRISHAQRLLATSDMKVVDVAMEAGFASLSRFYASFEDACQCSPRAYQKAVSSSAEPARSGRQEKVL